MGGVGGLGKDGRQIEHLLEEALLGGSRPGASRLYCRKADQFSNFQIGIHLLTNSKQDPGDDASLYAVILNLVSCVQ